MDSNLVLALTSIILVIVTSYYAFQTRKTVNVLEKTNTMQFRPALIGAIKIRNAIEPELQISNLGKGPATDVEIVVRSKENPDTTRFTHSTSLIAVNDKLTCLIPIGNNEFGIHIEDFNKRQYTLQIDFTYKDFLDISYSNYQEIDVTKNTTIGQNTLIREENDYSESLSINVQRIADELTKLGLSR